MENEISNQDNGAGRQPSPKWRARLAKILGLIAAIVVADQISKELILSWFFSHGQIIEITPFFNFVLVFNPGVSFGMFGGLGSSAPYILLMITSLILCGLSYWLWRLIAGPLKDKLSRYSLIGLALVIGGALGNNLDRMRFGAVVDFLDFHIFGWHWPAFNVADSAIFCGAIILIIASFFKPDDTDA